MSENGKAAEGEAGAAGTAEKDKAPGETAQSSISPSAKASTRTITHHGGIKRFFWDPDTKACLGRTCLSWRKIS